MKKLILILLPVLLPLATNAQVKSREEAPTKKEEAAPKIETPKPQPQTPPYAYLLVSTDLDVEVSVNFEKSYTILASVGGKNITVYNKTNLLIIRPKDGGKDGFQQTIEIEKGDTKIMNLHIGRDRKEVEEQKKQEQERVANQKRAEEERKRLEQERIAAEKRAEEERISSQKKAEEERNRQDNDAWNNARNSNTMESYQKYLDKFRNGLHVSEAQQRLNQFISEMDEPDWQEAKKSNTIVAYELYLQKHPSGKYTSVANSSINEQKTWQSISSNARIESYEDFLTKYPKSQYSVTAKSKLLSLYDAEISRTRSQKFQNNALPTLEMVGGVALGGLGGFGIYRGIKFLKEGDVPKAVGISVGLIGAFGTFLGLVAVDDAHLNMNGSFRYEIKSLQSRKQKYLGITMSPKYFNAENTVGLSVQARF